MTAKIRAQYGAVWVEVDASDIKEAFRELSNYAEIFGRNKTCGRCGEPTVIPEARHDQEGNHYYSLKCSSCYAELDLGQHRGTETLFSKRKDREGNWLDNNGWYLWSERQVAAGNPEPDDGGAF